MFQPKRELTSPTEPRVLHGISGVYFFRRFFMNRNWRITFVWTAAILALNNGFQLMVIFNASRFCSSFPQEIHTHPTPFSECLMKLEIWPPIHPIQIHWMAGQQKTSHRFWMFLYFRPGVLVKMAGFMLLAAPWTAALTVSMSKDGHQSTSDKSAWEL